MTNSGVKAEAKRLATYNSSAAKKLLTDNGFTYKGNNLIDPKGNPVKFDIHVISGWSDWVASLQIISKNLQDIGIDAGVKLEPDWGSWFPNATSTKFVTLLWQIAATGSPYGYFFNNMHKNTFVPSGEDAVNTGNFAHYQNAQATSLLDKWKATLDVAGQKKIATQVESLWLKELPIIPLFVGTQWSTLQHEELPLLPDAEESVCEADLQQLPRQLADSDPHLLRRCGGEQPDPVSPFQRPLGGAPPRPTATT